MLFVLISIVFSCSTMEIKNENLPTYSGPQNNELQGLIQLKKSAAHKEKKGKTRLQTSTGSTYKKINPQQAYEKSCKSASIIQNRYLRATCDGKSSTLDLNDCLYAEGGVLIYDEEGYFYDSCSKCRLNYPTWQGKKQPVNFECKCYDDDLNEIKTNINLEDFVYFDKELKCANIDPRKLPAPKEIDTNCQDAEISENNQFLASCKSSKSTGGKAYDSNFSLMNCMQNNNGHFDYGTGFGKTCHFCEITKEHGVYVLTCDCEDARQSRRREYKPLNSFFEIEDSKIICHDPNKKKEKPAPKKFEIKISPAKIKKGVEIKVKPGKIENTVITIPATKKTINKKTKETTKINMKNSTTKIVTIPIEAAPKEPKKVIKEDEEEIETDSGAIINYDPDLSPSDNFMRNCQNFSFGGNVFTAECGSNKKLLELDFNKCIGNINGKLKFAKDGNYGNSCTDCTTDSNGYGVYFLNCKCKVVSKNLRHPDQIMASSNVKNTRISLGEKIIILQKTNKISCLPDLVLENEDNITKCNSQSFLSKK